jgi:hypothetical protein
VCRQTRGRDDGSPEVGLPTGVQPSTATLASSSIACLCQHPPLVQHLSFFTSLRRSAALVCSRLALPLSLLVDMPAAARQTRSTYRWWH